MSRVSLIPQVMDALISLWSETVPEGAVFDGPGTASDIPKLMVMVGVSDPDATSPEAATSDQQWAWADHRQRDETMQVHCSIVAWSGDTDRAAVKGLRDQVFDTLRRLTDALEQDPTLGGLVLFVSRVSGLRLLQDQVDIGAAANLTFTVEARARP